MEKERLRALIMSPVMEDVLIGLPFLRGAYKLKDIKEILPGGTSYKKSYSIMFPKTHDGMVLKGYKIHNSLYMRINYIGLYFTTDPITIWGQKIIELL